MEEVSLQITQLLKDEYSYFVISGILGAILIILSCIFIFIIKYKAYVGFSIPMLINAGLLLYNLSLLSETNAIIQQANEHQDTMLTLYLSKKMVTTLTLMLLICVLMIALALIYLTRHSIFWKNCFISLTIQAALLFCFTYIHYRIITKIIVILHS